VAAAAAAVAVQALTHAAFPGVPFAPFSAGEWFIRRAPGGFATFAIETLGHDAQYLLAAGTIAIALALGYALGHSRGGVLASAAAVATIAATVLDPRRPSAFGIATAAAIAALAAWLGASLLVPNVDAPVEAPVDLGRRRLIGGIGLGAGALALGGLSAARALARDVAARIVRADRPAAVLPDPSFRAPAGLTSRITSRSRHYTVDINLVDPSPGPDWRLKVHGAVERALSLSMNDLRGMPTIEQPFTLSCISNEVGGDLVGTALWTGVPARALLGLARPRLEARALRAMAADGYSESYPLGLVMREDFLVAFGMNGVELPRAHGHPVRLIVPGRYGMKNVKWLTELVLTREEVKGYWEQRGWDMQAVIRTESRFDLPEDGATVGSPFVAGGVAWAGDRGVSAVEVSTDDGETWTPAELERELGPLTWRRWRVRLRAPEGTSYLLCRAVDSRGLVQDAEQRPPHPSGATGYHRIEVHVRG
jgi:DMSO/TMAO reductase YedYZ molybdopterin-dependent catalytic subunit